MSQVQNQIQRYKGRWWGAVKHSSYAPRDLFLAEKTGTPRHKFGRVVKCSPTTSFFFFSFFFSLKKKNSFSCSVQHVGPEFPDQGSNPCRLHWRHGVLTNGPPRKCILLIKRSLFLFDQLKSCRHIWILIFSL